MFGFGIPSLSQLNDRIPDFIRKMGIKVAKKLQEPPKEPRKSKALSDFEQKNLMDTYARLSRDVYETQRARDIKGHILQPEYSTEKRAVYFNPSTGKYVVAQRGTVPTDRDDLQDDVLVVKDELKSSKRHKDEKKFLEKLIADKGKDNIILTGHSLGSNHSKLLSKEFDLPMYGFSEGETVSADKIVENFFDRGDDRVQNFKVSYDPVSLLNPFSKNVKAKSKNPHALENFIDDSLLTQRGTDTKQEFSQAIRTSRNPERTRQLAEQLGLGDFIVV
jgi:hypothetical protein